MKNDELSRFCNSNKANLFWYLGKKYKVNKDYYLKIMERTNLLIEKISKKKVVQNTLITTYGLDSNEYSNVFITLLLLANFLNFKYINIV